jgi:DNA adenine methylase
MIPSGTTDLHSPFLGGASLELAWLAANPSGRLHAGDLFEPLACFWSEVFAGRQVDLVEIVQRYHPIDKATFVQLQALLRSGDGSRLERAAWFYVVNRSSFSGATLSGGMGGGDRFTQSAIDRLRAFQHAGCIEFRQSDAFSVLSNDDGSLTAAGSTLFLDPPYWLDSSALYGDRGSTHRGFDHRALAEAFGRLNAEGARILMTYNTDPRVVALYAGCEGVTIEPARWAYGMSADKLGKEIVIKSAALATPAMTLIGSEKVPETVPDRQASFINF